MKRARQSGRYRTYLRTTAAHLPVQAFPLFSWALQVALTPTLAIVQVKVSIRVVLSEWRAGKVPELTLSCP